MCHLGGGFGRNGNGPQAEQAIYLANQNRGTPIHLLWTREEDFISSAYRAMGVARLRAALDADGWPIAGEVRTAIDEKALVLPSPSTRSRVTTCPITASRPTPRPFTFPWARGESRR
jgi:hypothetical protein